MENHHAGNDPAAFRYDVPELLLTDCGCLGAALHRGTAHTAVELPGQIIACYCAADILGWLNGTVMRP